MPLVAVCNATGPQVHDLGVGRVIMNFYGFYTEVSDKGA